MKCSKCKTNLQSSYVYVKRKRISIGQFCIVCGVIRKYSKSYGNYQEQKLKEKRKQDKSKPKFQKQRKPCPFCLEKGIINRSRWSLRKMPKKKNQTQHWKGTCHKCGNIWSQNTSEEYFIIDPNQDFTNGL